MIVTVCAGLFLVLVCVDMGIKQYVEDWMKEHEERKTILPGILFRKVYNTGFAFNFLDRYPKIIRNSSIVSMIGIVCYDLMIFLKKGRNICKIGMTFVSAGAFSNIYDRLIRKKVVDYIGVESKHSYLGKLTANLADIYIVIGMILVSFSKMVHGKKNK